MTIKQLWMATVTLFAVAALSRPEAVWELANYSVETLALGLMATLEHLLAKGIGY